MAPASSSSHPVRRHRFNISSETRRLLGARGAAVARGRDTTEIDRDLGAQRIQDFIENMVAEWPPLTEAQRDRLALLIQRGDGVER